MIHEIPSKEVSRSYYQDGEKPDTEKMKAAAAVGGGKGATKTYHPFDDKSKNGTVTTYSNDNKVTIWDCVDAEGNVTKATAVKIGNKTYYDWESDGKIDCVDTETVIQKKIEINKDKLKSILEKKQNNSQESISISQDPKERINKIKNDFGLS